MIQHDGVQKQKTHVVRTNDKDSSYRFPVPPTLNIFHWHWEYTWGDWNKILSKSQTEYFQVVLKKYSEGFEQNMNLIFVVRYTTTSHMSFKFSK